MNYGLCISIWFEEKIVKISMSETSSFASHFDFLLLFRIHPFFYPISDQSYAIRIKLYFFLFRMLSIRINRTWVFFYGDAYCSRNCIQFCYTINIHMRLARWFIFIKLIVWSGAEIVVVVLWLIFVSDLLMFAAVICFPVLFVFVW